MKAGNALYYGDNLEILSRYIGDETVDLVYLDPPFNSNQDYNVLFADKHGARSAAQVNAFEDTWHWDQTAEAAYVDVVERGGKVAESMRAFRTFLGENDMMAYLAMMAPRLLELRRVLKPTGSIYLHCDPTASHYLKLLMDGIFGPVNFRNEVVWKRSQPKAHATVRYSRAHDVLLFYAKSSEARFLPQYTAHDPEYVEKFYRFKEESTGRRYRLGDLTNPNKNRPNLTYEFPPGSGTVRVWRWTRERMLQAYKDGIVVVQKGGVASAKRYLDEMPGTPVTDFWSDIEHLHGTQQESLGYPTQKPEALLERIILASSDPGDIVLDPFCGCGTSIAAAQRLGRRWVGIDVTHLAITLMKHRLHSSYGAGAKFTVIGEPADMAGAAALAKDDPYQFQWWALGLLGARPVEQKKGADRGIDGRLYFHDAGPSGKTKQIIFSVKAGKVSVPHVRDLVGVLSREEAQIGVLVSLEEPTREMRKEAASAGFYVSEWDQRKHPRLQLLTIAEIMNGKAIDYPPSQQVNVTFKRAPRAKSDPSAAENLALPLDDNVTDTKPIRGRRGR